MLFPDVLPHGGADGQSAQVVRRFGRCCLMFLPHVVQGGAPPRQADGFNNQRWTSQHGGGANGDAAAEAILQLAHNRDVRHMCNMRSHTRPAHNGRGTSHAAMPKYRMLIAAVMCSICL